MWSCFLRGGKLINLTPKDHQNQSFHFLKIQTVLITLGRSLQYIFISCYRIASENNNI